MCTFDACWAATDPVNLLDDLKQPQHSYCHILMFYLLYSLSLSPPPPALSLCLSPRAYFKSFIPQFQEGAFANGKL